MKKPGAEASGSTPIRALRGIRSSETLGGDYIENHFPQNFLIL
jgi:hypothetical protein